MQQLIAVRFSVDLTGKEGERDLDFGDECLIT